MNWLIEVLWWLAFVIGLCGTALLSGFETGIYRLSRVKLEVRSERGPHQRAARLLKREVAQPQRLLAANLIANVFFGDLAATGATNLLARWGYSDGAIILINVAILTPIFFVFAESVPKELFRMEADSLTYRFVTPVAGVRWFLSVTGIIPLVGLFADATMKVIGLKPDAGAVATGRERLISLLKDTAGEAGTPATLSESQVHLLDRALEFGRTSVVDEMLPWARVPSIRPAWSRGTILTMLARSPQPFLPVVERDQVGRQAVLGVIRVQDLFTRPEVPLARHAQEPARLPPRLSLREAVVRLRQAPIPVGIVEDGGRPLGLVTMSDLIEPLLRADE